MASASFQVSSLERQKVCRVERLTHSSQSENRNDVRPRMQRWLWLSVAVLTALSALFVRAQAADDTSSPFLAMFPDSKAFVQAISREANAPAFHARVTGITVPHHVLAIDLIARGFQAASANHYDRIIILSPDHYSRSRRPLATTTRDFDTALGKLNNDRVATAALLTADALFDDSDLFAKEHGVGALTPFVRHFFPKAKIIPIAISYSASREECDQALVHIASLIGPDTLVVQSTDYSHYLPAEIARQRDQETLNVIAAEDVDSVFRLQQPAHMDSKAAQYMQMRLQSTIFNSKASVIANANSIEYGATGSRTTSYIVTVYANGLPSTALSVHPAYRSYYFAGDTFIGRYFTPALTDDQVAKSVVQEVRKITGGASLIVNLEGVLFDESPENENPNLHSMYQSLAIPILQALNVAAASLANNHAADFGLEGLAQTRSILQRSGIRPLDHRAVVDVGPFRVLGLNFVGKFNYRGYPVVKGDDLNDVCYLSARPPLFAFVHWGEEYIKAASAEQYAASKTLQNCGVTAIVGAHPHVASDGIEAPQGGEYQLVNSLGNFLFDQTSERSSGALLEVRVFQQQTLATRLIPIRNMFEFANDLARPK
jgi:AmmeMemoRadiSam system protein B